MNTARLKRLIIIVGFVLAVLGLMVLFWYLFFRPLAGPQPAANENVNVPGGPLPNVNVNRPMNINGIQPVAVNSTLPVPAEIANGGVTRTTDVSPVPTNAATIAPDGKDIVFYDSDRGKFVRLDPETGTLTDLVSQKFASVQNVTWSPDSTKAVLEFPDDRKLVYDFSTKKQYTFPTQAQEFSFSADSQQLAYKYLGSTPDEKILVTSDITGNAARSVANIGDKEEQVQVALSPDDRVVGMYREGINGQQQQVVLIGRQQENFKTITTRGRGFQGRWTPDGTKMLYTVYAEATNWNPELYLVRAAGDQIGQGNTDLGIATFVDKCTFNAAGTHAYCAVPDALDRGSGLYPEFAAAAKYSFVTINLATAAVTPLAQPVGEQQQQFSVDRVFLTSDERTLYFTDAQTRHVHKLRLR